MSTTPRPVWLRGAPAQLAGAGKKSVITSWSISPTTSVLVSVVYQQRTGMVGVICQTSVVRGKELMCFSSRNLYAGFTFRSLTGHDSVTESLSRKSRPTALRYKMFQNVL